MEEIIYKSKFYIYIVVAYISFLLLNNGFKMLVTQDIFAALVLTVQAIVLYQIYLKHRYVKLGIKTWTFFPIVKEGTLLTIDFLRLVSGGEEFIDTESTMKSAFFLLAAILIYVFCDRSIKVIDQKIVK